MVAGRFIDSPTPIPMGADLGVEDCKIDAASGGHEKRHPGGYLFYWFELPALPACYCLVSSFSILRFLTLKSSLGGVRTTLAASRMPMSHSFILMDSYSSRIHSV